MFVNNLFIYFFVAFYLSAFSVKACLLYPILFDLSRTFSNFFFIPESSSCRHQPQQLMSLPSALCFVNTFFHFSLKNFNSRESSVFFKNTPAFLLWGARHAFVWPISSAHLCICAPPKAVSDWGLTPTTDTDLLPAIHRGGSHFSIWCIWYRLQVQCQLSCPLRLHNSGKNLEKRS